MMLLYRQGFITHHIAMVLGKTVWAIKRQASDLKWRNVYAPFGSKVVWQCI